MFTIRNEQLEALAQDAARRARAEWLESLRARGIKAREESGRVVIEDAAGGQARIDPHPDGLAVTSGEGRTFRFEYDSAKRLKAMTDPAGVRFACDYDDKHRLTALHRGKQNSFSFAYDANGQVSSIHYPDNSATRFVYDDSGRVAGVIDRNGHRRVFEYSEVGLPRRFIDAKGAETIYEYDTDGELEAVISPRGDRLNYEVDEVGGFVSVFQDEHKVFDLTVDPKTGTQEFRYSDGGYARFEYDGNRLIAASNETCTVILTYDEKGFIETEVTEGRVVRYERNALGALIGLITPEGERITFDRDSEHRLRRVTDSGGQPIEIEYGLSGALATIRYPNGVVLNRKSTPLGLPSALTVTSAGEQNALLAFKWTYDACDRVIFESGPEGTWREFSYDPEGRLTAVFGDDPEVNGSYSLDPNGNRVVDNGVRCAVNALDQLIRCGSDPFEYDPQGCMSKGITPVGPARFYHNLRGQLVEVSTAGGKARYAYDPFGRRIRKEIVGQDGRLQAVTRFTWAGHHLLSEVTQVDAQERTRRDYLIAPDLGIQLGLRVGSNRFYVHHGRRLEALAITDETGSIVWKATYSAFGQAQILIKDMRYPIRLPGQYYDAETGLHYNLARYYHPQLGRFVERDPLGFESGSWNEYSYCDGDPLNRYDPIGENYFLIGLGIGVAIAAGIAYLKQKRAKPNSPINWWEVGKEAAIGFVAVLAFEFAWVALLPSATAFGVGIGLALPEGIGEAVSLMATVAVQGGGAAAVAACAEATFRGDSPDPSNLLTAAVLGMSTAVVLAGASLAIGGWLARRAAGTKLPLPPEGVTPAVHNEELTISRHTIGGKAVVKDLAKGREAHVFNEGTNLKDLEHKVWTEGKQQPDVRGYQRFTYESKEPVGIRIQEGKPEVPLHTVEIKGRVTRKGTWEYHMTPRTRPARPRGTVK